MSVWFSFQVDWSGLGWTGLDRTGNCCILFARDRSGRGLEGIDRIYKCITLSFSHTQAQQIQCQDSWLKYDRRSTLHSRRSCSRSRAAVAPSCSLAESVSNFQIGVDGWLDDLGNAPTWALRTPEDAMLTLYLLRFLTTFFSVLVVRKISQFILKHH